MINLNKSRKFVSKIDWANFEILLPYSPLLAPAFLGSIYYSFKPEGHTGTRWKFVILFLVLSSLIMVITNFWSEIRKKDNIPKNKLSILIR